MKYLGQGQWLWFGLDSEDAETERVEIWGRGKYK